MGQEIGGDQTLMVTPFNEDCSIDEQSTKKLADFLIDGGVHGILALGTTGEFFSMGEYERKKFMSVVTEHVNGRVQTGFCCAHPGTQIACELSKHAEDTGADYILMTPPYYFSHSTDSIFEHISKVASSTDLPIMAYDGGGGIELTIDLLEQLSSEHSNIRYVKVATRSPGKVKTIMETFGADLTAFCGDESMSLMELSDGAAGLTLGAGNIQPTVTSKMFELHEKGDREGARKLFYEKLMPQVGICNIAWREYIQCFKTVLWWKGIIRTPLARQPLLPLDTTRTAELKKVMEHLGVI